ncbi:hypothetical protein Tco_0988254 [Tanacetum coccineum]|uniref:Uncharacterized protein n=1 Tax=Tanacetum coccineum TaxID=301880 RepID=A0ABQ5EQH8_9ASTR
MKWKDSLLQPPIVRRSGEANGSGGANRPPRENRAAMENKTMGQSGQTGQPIQKHQLGWYMAGDMDQWMVEILEKSMKDLGQARKKDKENFEEAIGKERRLNSIQLTNLS